MEGNGHVVGTVVHSLSFECKWVKVLASENTTMIIHQERDGFLVFWEESSKGFCLMADVLINCGRFSMISHREIIGVKGADIMCPFLGRQVFCLEDGQEEGEIAASFFVQAERSSKSGLFLVEFGTMS